MFRVEGKHRVDDLFAGVDSISCEGAFLHYYDDDDDDYYYCYFHCYCYCHCYYCYDYYVTLVIE